MDLDGSDVLAGIIVFVISYAVIAAAQQGNLNAEILQAAITGYTLAGALIAGLLGLFIRNYFRTREA